MNCKDCTDYGCSAQGYDYDNPNCDGDKFNDEIPDEIIDAEFEDISDLDGIEDEVERTLTANNFVISLAGNRDEVNATLVDFFAELEELLNEYFGGDWAYGFDVEDK
jgi:hypothetical protein